MKNKSFYFIFLFFLALSLSIFSVKVFAGNRSAESDVDTYGSAEFKDPTLVEDVLTFSRKNKMKVTLLESDFLLGTTPIHDFYPINLQTNPGSIETDYIKARLGALKDSINERKNLSNEEQQALAPQFEAAELLLKNGYKEKIRISKATFSGKKSELEKFSKKSNIKKLDIFDTGTKVDKQKKHKEVPNNKFSEGGQVSALAATGYQWMPVSGTSISDVAAEGGRYAREYMKWDSNVFAPEDTYEHDFFLYNYDGQTYLNGASTPPVDCFPVITYASTTWPAESKPYLDSRYDLEKFRCEIDELAYTIGAAKADKIASGVLHYNYIRTSNGNAASSKFKINAQLGYRSADTCYTTWCSWSESQVIMVPFRDGVPGSIPWTYTDIIPLAPSDVSVTDPTSSSLRLNFRDNASNESGTKIERKIGNGSWSQYGTFGTLSNTGLWYWVNTGLASNTTYCYRLRAYNNKGDSSYSNEACGTTTQSTSRSQVIVDDSTSGFSRGGSWWAEANIGYNGHMYWTYVNGSAVDSWGEWSANLAGGNYEVYAFIPRDYATTANAIYQIYYNGGTASRSVNQNNYYDVWVSLGTYNFSSGTSRRIRLTDATGETNYNLRVGFDAVGFVPR